jgi:hypothetical protein
MFDMYIQVPCEASSWTLLHQNRKLSSQISLQNQLFCLIGSDRAHCECMRRFASFGTTHVIHCIITNCACLSGNEFTNWCPSSRRVFKSIKVIFYCSWAVHLERNISFKESIHNCNCSFPWFNLSLLIICCVWQLPLFHCTSTQVIILHDFSTYIGLT